MNVDCLSASIAEMRATRFVTAPKEKKTGGKSHVSAVGSLLAEREPKDSLWRWAVGGSLVWKIQLDGVEVEALVDTGPQVPTVAESWFQRHLTGSRSLGPVHRFRLTAAKGTDIPTTRYMLAKVAIGEESVAEVPILIVKDAVSPNGQPPCLLGMNVLQGLDNFPEMLKTTLPGKGTEGSGQRNERRGTDPC